MAKRPAPKAKVRHKSSFKVALFELGKPKDMLAMAKIFELHEKGLINIRRESEPMPNGFGKFFREFVWEEKRRLTPQESAEAERLDVEKLNEKLANNEYTGEKWKDKDRPINSMILSDDEKEALKEYEESVYPPDEDAE
jgi:hypothetical protein